MLSQTERSVVESTPGFLHPDEGKRLHDLTLEAGRKGPVLEIGSYCGKSAVYIGSACRQTGATLFSIDHHRGSEEQQPGETYFDPALYDIKTGRVDTLPAFRHTLDAAGLNEVVVAVIGASAVVARSWQTPLALVFVDGGHDPASARADVFAWSPHILPGGFLAIHDIFPDPADGGQGPYQAYLEIIASGQFAECAMTKTLGVLQRIN
ncbi:MAG: hypothetical protein CSA22_03280 [Deltaproteobacteria bacterium]|nr:MAG: hypothetical protein CSA22_03280 [Deltaproteobacteria bacterium]